MSADSGEQLVLVDIGPRRPIQLRYADIVTIQPRCCNCGTQWSFWWGTWKDRSVCGDCCGVTPAEVACGKQNNMPKATN